MVRVSRVLLFKDGGGGGGNALLTVLSEILVCPLSKQPLRFFSLHQKKIVSALPMQLLHSFLQVLLFHSRHCPDSRSLVSDAVGVSFPVSLDYLFPLL